MSEPTTVTPIHAAGTRGARPPPLSYAKGKGHISVNPVAGCGIGCPYCLNIGDGIGPGKQTLSSVEEILDTLEDGSTVVRRLRLSVMDFCDPFDAANRRVLRELLDGLATRLPGQAATLTTRLHPGDGVLDWLAGLDLRLSVFVSMGDAASRFPPLTPVPPRLSLLEECRARGLHAAMLLKPLVREWVDPQALSRLLACARLCGEEIVVGGLKLSPRIEESLRERGWPVPAGFAPSDGAMDPGLLKEIREIAQALDPRLVVYERRSCAANQRHRLPCMVAGVPAARRRDPLGPVPIGNHGGPGALGGDPPERLHVVACSCGGDLLPAGPVPNEPCPFRIAA